MTSVRRCIALLATFVVATACNAVPSPSAGGSPSASVAVVDEDAVYDEIQAEVIALRGVEPTEPVSRQVLTEDEMIARVTALFEADNPADYVEASELTLKALGLLQPDVSLQDTYLDALQSQVLGFYSHRDDELFVVSRSGNLGALEKSTFAHEFTHALQDQAFEYWAEAETWRDNGDLALARSALVEGDATALMTTWAIQHLTPDEAAELLRAGLDPAEIAKLAALPAILREQLSFPYQQGLSFVTTLQGTAGFEPVDRAYADPPSSTEHILHPDRYQAGDEPVQVEAAEGVLDSLGDGWTVGLEDTMGEFQLRIWLREALKQVTLANDAAAGWGGDRLVLAKGPQGAWALAIVSEWDTPADAVQFEEAAAEAVVAGPFPGATAFQTGSTQVRVMIASDAATLTLLDVAMGTTGV